MAELNPAAQAVLDAAYSELDYVPQRHVRWCAAAALRAAADQVACDMPDDNAYAAGFCAALGEVDAIATELENQ